METCVSSDDELLRLAREFDHQALERIYDVYSPGLYRYAMRLLGNAMLAEDCVAETFTRFLQSLEKHRGPREHLQAFLYRSAHNWIVDHYRRSDRNAELDEDLQDGDRSTEERASDHLHQEKIRSALQKLTPDQHQVIVLKYLEGWDNEAISRAVAKPVGAVKSLQHRALERLRGLLKEEDVT